MNTQELLNTFTEQLLHTKPLEAVAVIFGMVSVVLANRNHVALYPTGIVSTAIYIYLMGKPSVGLYAEAMLNAYYFIMSIYGWIVWYKGSESENPSAISHNNRKDWITTILIVIIGWTVIYLLLTRFTDSNVPAIDAFVSSTACAGMWLLAKHKIENWVLLNISNAVAIPLLIYKGMPFTSFLTLFLFIVAIFGYFRWKKQYRLLHAA